MCSYCYQQYWIHCVSKTVPILVHITKIQEHYVFHGMNCQKVVEMKCNLNLLGIIWFLFLSPMFFCAVSLYQCYLDGIDALSIFILGLRIDNEESVVDNSLLVIVEQLCSINGRNMMSLLSILWSNKGWKPSPSMLWIADEDIWLLSIFRNEHNSE